MIISFARAGSYWGVPVECRELGIELGHHTLPAACSSFRVCLPASPPSFSFSLFFSFLWFSVLSSSSTTTTTAKIPAGWGSTNATSLTVCQLKKYCGRATDWELGEGEKFALYSTGPVAEFNQFPLEWCHSRCTWFISGLHYQRVSPRSVQIYLHARLAGFSGTEDRCPRLICLKCLLACLLDSGELDWSTLICCWRPKNGVTIANNLL